MNTWLATWLQLGRRRGWTGSTRSSVASLPACRSCPPPPVSPTHPPLLSHLRGWAAKAGRRDSLWFRASRRAARRAQANSPLAVLAHKAPIVLRPRSLSVSPKRQFPFCLSCSLSLARARSVRTCLAAPLLPHLAIAAGRGRMEAGCRGLAG